MEERLFIVQKRSVWSSIDLAEIWGFRELIYFLVWRDLKLRYRQTVLGVAWVLLQPCAMLGVFWMVFGRLSSALADASPYPLFVLAGILPFQLFSRALVESSNSLITNQKLITKVYFPRIIVPTANLFSGLLDFAIGVLLLVPLMWYYGEAITARVIFLPLILLLLMVATLGIGFWLSALNAEYRDVSYTLPFLNQLWFFCTPIVYSSGRLPANWQALIALNPLTGIVEGMRWCLLHDAALSPRLLLSSLLVSLTLFVSGALWFRHRERTFVDVLGS